MDWLDQPAKLAQKDLDARWTKKRGDTYYDLETKAAMRRAIGIEKPQAPKKSRGRRR